MNTTALLKQSLRFLVRDWRSGELRVLALALVIAVASTAAVGFFTDRVRLAMERQSGELLGADLVVESPEPIAESMVTTAARMGLDTARTLSFRSVILAGEADNPTTSLAEVKAVGPGYPLRGIVELAEEPFGESRPTREIPSPGAVWLDPRLFQTLGVAVGESVEVGASRLTVERVLAYEPDRGGDFFSIAPRLMMNLADVPATELVQMGSRVEHRLLLAGPIERVDAFRAWAAPRLSAVEELEGVRDARPELQVALDRAQRFLGLAALVSVILAGVGIAIAARRFAARHWDSAAVLRAMGATQRIILTLFTLEMLWLALGAGLTGVVLGYLAQSGLAGILGGLAGGEMPLPSPAPAGPALAVGLITLLGFALPPLIRLKDVPPLRVLRRDLGPADRKLVGLYLPALIAAGALIFWQAGDPKLALYVFGGALVTLVVLALAAWGLVRALRLLRGRVGVAWRFGLSNIARRGAGSVVQVVALGLGIMVLLVLTLVRNDLLTSWQDTLPPDAPNHFLINIQTQDVPRLREFLEGRTRDGAVLHPMIRGRLVGLDGREVSPGDYANPRAQRLVEREFNLSWTDTLQDDNRIVEGRWWRPEDTGRPVVSVEAGIAETLGIELGDTLTYRIAGEEIQAEVISLRTVEWDSFRANFFVLFPPGVLDDYPAQWITAFYLEPQNKPVLAQLVREFPSVTVIDVDALMTKVRQIMDRVTLAVEYVFLFTLAAGLVVLYAAIQATQDERRFEAAMLRTLGADKAVVLKSVLAEFALLGLLAGVLASVGAAGLGWGLGRYLFDFPYNPDPLLALVGAGAGLLGVGAAGLLGARPVLAQPPMRTLREG